MCHVRYYYVNNKIEFLKRKEMFTFVVDAIEVDTPQSGINTDVTTNSNNLEE